MNEKGKQMQQLTEDYKSHILTNPQWLLTEAYVSEDKTYIHGEWEYRRNELEMELRGLGAGEFDVAKIEMSVLPPEARKQYLDDISIAAAYSPKDISLLADVFEITEPNDPFA